MKSAKRIAALLLCAALIFSTGISAASYGGARREAVSASDEAGLVEALTQSGEKAEPAKTKKPGTLTECGGACEHSPTVVIHGIGQSKTYLYEDDEIAVDEDGKMITGWPIYANTKYIVKNLLLPLVKMLVTQRDDGFVESFRKTLEGTLYVNAFDSNGKNISVQHRKVQRRGEE